MKGETFYDGEGRGKEWSLGRISMKRYSYFRLVGVGLLIACCFPGLGMEGHEVGYLTHFLYYLTLYFDLSSPLCSSQYLPPLSSLFRPAAALDHVTRLLQSKPRVKRISLTHPTYNNGARRKRTSRYGSSKRSQSAELMAHIPC